MPVDPVCGMELDEEGAVASTLDGLTYYFCSDDCAQEFMEAPEDYVGATAQPSPEEER